MTGNKRNVAIVTDYCPHGTNNLYEDTHGSPDHESLIEEVFTITVLPERVTFGQVIRFGSDNWCGKFRLMRGGAVLERG